MEANLEYVLAAMAKMRTNEQLFSSSLLDAQESRHYPSGYMSLSPISSTRALFTGRLSVTI